MNKYLKFASVAAFLAISTLFSPSVFAAENPVTGNTIEYRIVDREANLKSFLVKYKSPLADYASVFIQAADKYNIDYRILPAISCIESTCGKFLLPETHNPFGWGKGIISFVSYYESINKVQDGMYKIYYSKGLDTPEKIAPVYDPPSPETWSRAVRSFMNQIDSVE
ncbi:MAG TPA: hypothetical protein VLI92_00870 [Candidatus Saccharimonadales bacterium]|nr:hypothetical protein [Candidatus Saccharimonadales bacterium]